MSSEFINQVLELTNIERAKAGLKPLKLNSQLLNAAQDHSKDMAQDDFFSHTGVDGSSVSDRVQDNGYQYSTVGENIAAGQRTAAEVVEGWMNSPGHRANILNANYTEIGIGYVYLENDTGSVNYNHYWTQVFGTPLSSNSNGGSNSELPIEKDIPPPPVAEVENPQTSTPMEEGDNNSSEVEDLVTPKGNNGRDLTGKPEDSSLTGDNDAVDFSKEKKVRWGEYQDTNNRRWSNFPDLFSDSWLGNGTNSDSDSETTDIMEYASNVDGDETKNNLIRGFWDAFI
jgi:hypothetical protein